MSKFGFVYLLGNLYMNDCYKIGCTERSPHQRADELSTTGVPAPFDVICYIEIENFQDCERKFHEYLKEYRVSTAREFFFGLNMSLAVGLFKHNPVKLSYSDVNVGQYTDADAIFDPWEKPSIEKKADVSTDLKLVANE